MDISGKLIEKTNHHSGDLAELLEGAASEIDLLRDEKADLVAKVERLTADISNLKAAADPFVRATRLQEPLGLSDEMPVRDWLPGSWPTTKDARRLVQAVRGADHQSILCPRRLGVGGKG